MPAALMQHDTDPRQELLDKLGSLDDFELFHNQVLVAIYLRPQKTKGGIYLTDKSRDEDVYQGKVGLIVKVGPQAFEADGKWFDGVSFALGDWVVFKPSDGWSLTVNSESPCRILDDVDIRGRVQQPDTIW